MSKEPLQDMIPSGKRSIRRVDISRTRKTSKPRIQQEENTLSPRRNGRSRSGARSWGVWAGVLLAVLVLGGLFLSLFFSGARVEITPRQEVVSVEGVFSARQGAEFGELSYETMKVEQEAVREVPASGEEQVERKASGTITIYNTYDENPQRLIKNTRFESAQGLIFRIPESVVVPGMDGTTPGSITTEVQADTSGDEYNVPAGRFTIPGLESDPDRFKAFYAESSKAMSGGFSGITKVVSEDDRALAESALESELREALIAAARSQTPEGFLFFTDASLITFNPVFAAEGSTDDMAKLTMKGTLHGIIFDEETFGEYIALQTISDYDRSPIVVHDPTTLRVTLPERDALIPAALERADISITGTPRLVWLFDETTLLADLAGAKKDAAERIFSGYPAIQEAEVVVRPFWKGSFPSDVEEIELDIIVGEE